VFVVAPGRSEIGRKPREGRLDRGRVRDSVRREQGRDTGHVRRGHRGALQRDLGVGVESGPDHEERVEVGLVEAGLVDQAVGAGDAGVPARGQQFDVRAGRRVEGALAGRADGAYGDDAVNRRGVRRGVVHRVALLEGVAR
jgi:hypothetical protein